MKLFDTTVHKLKHDVIKEIIRNEYYNEYSDLYLEIPKKISPGPKAHLRCCVFKERAILQERIKLALGGDNKNPNIVEVIDIACDECPAGCLYVTPSCRNCLTKRCTEVCPKNAIKSFDKRMIIDRNVCVECGKCISACPYGAIIQQKRPCISSCKVKAIRITNEDKIIIDIDKCIGCGACIYQCPFGAISDKSYIVDAMRIIRNKQSDNPYKVYAVVAPSIISQFKYAKLGQVVTGIKAIGFDSVIEAAMGADIVIHKELDELKAGHTLTSSCCPAFVSLIEKKFPELLKYVSSSLSPMVEAALVIKRKDPTCKIIFIGPCSAKKLEFKLEKTKGAIDCVLSFEELQAYFSALEIEIESLEETVMDDASLYGRIFARSGGITQGIRENAAKAGLKNINPIAMNGITEINANLLKLKLNRAEANFFEGMACDGGCIGGALCLSHGLKNAQEVDKYGASATQKEIDHSVMIYEQSLKL
ncbi:MAG: monomeric [FeFe] hydrogenase [Christensenellaceae bacterium]|jgi:[FeFe] hydrogenase (group B1/B3)|nr:monomeric [FeFe] hydrogenase [Christensenellaceae bacterium]